VTVTRGAGSPSASSAEVVVETGPPGERLVATTALDDLRVGRALVRRGAERVNSSNSRYSRKRSGYCPAN
jgi:hypothetical protein